MENANLNNEDFLLKIPYNNYLSDHDIRDFAVLDQDRLFCINHGRDGDSFLTNLFSQYISLHPVDPRMLSQLQPYFLLANRALAHSQDGGPHIYHTIGQLILIYLNGRAKEAIKTGQLTKRSASTPYLLSALAENNYFIFFPPNRLEKLKLHLLKGDWRYLALRSWEEILEYHFALLGMLLLAASITSVAALVLRKRAKTRSVPAVASSVKILKTFFGILFFTSLCNVQNANAQVLSEAFLGQYAGNNMVLARLYSGFEEIGTTVYIRRGSDRIRTKYFASGQVYQRYAAFPEKPALVCSGSFTGQTDQGLKPQGLTVDAGTIVNNDLNMNMDGLVIVYATGGLVVADIKSEPVTVYDDYGIAKHLNLLKPLDLISFRDWAVKQRATVFQTQLLAYTSGLRLDVARAHKENRERRFLAVVRDPKANNEVIYVIINIPKPHHYYLGPLAASVYQYLNAKANVVALLNLDVGAFDVFQVSPPTGAPLDYPKGDTPIQEATNLLEFYYAR